MRTIGKTFTWWFALLVVVSFAMGFVQWLAAPEGYGASGWAHALPQMGHPTLGTALGWLSTQAERLRGIDHFWQNVINAPRNQLLHAFRAVESIDFYTISERVGYWPDIRDALLLIVGTIVVYLPLVIGIAFIRNGWSVTKEPVLISSLLFIIVAIGFLTVSQSAGESKLAVILAALSLLTAAVGISWSPLLSRRSRFATLASFLIVCSVVGMFAVTKGSGPRDPLSYPLFFGWTFVMLFLKGGSFLSVVWILLRLMERLRGDVPPPPMELTAAK